VRKVHGCIAITLCVTVYLAPVLKSFQLSNEAKYAVTHITLAADASQGFSRCGIVANPAISKIIVNAL